MSSGKTHAGGCFCGAVRFEVSGEPKAMGYCHCEPCRHWSAGPVNASSLWQAVALKIMQGASHIGTFNKSANSYRKWCTKCGGHLYTNHPGMGLVNAYAAVIPSLKFAPGVHVNYQETVLRIHDGQPKLKDFPKEMCGSGINLPE